MWTIVRTVNHIAMTGACARLARLLFRGRVGDKQVGLLRTWPGALVIVSDGEGFLERVWVDRALPDLECVDSFLELTGVNQ